MVAEETTISRVALVTGAGHGIGSEVCRQLARLGMTVILTARDPEKAETAVEQLVGENLDVRPKTLDVSNDESARRLADELDREFGRLDVLVNNAAAYADWSEMASTADLEAAQEVLLTNLFGPWRTCQVFLPLIRRSEHGRIVNVSSGAGSHGDPLFGLATNRGSAASYGISKAALNALTVKLAAELEGTLVNAVCPGLTATAPGMEAMGARPIPEGAASVVWAPPSPTMVQRAASSAAVSPCPGEHTCADAAVDYAPANPTRNALPTAQPPGGRNFCYRHRAPGGTGRTAADRRRTRD